MWHHYENKGTEHTFSRFSADVVRISEEVFGRSAQAVLDALLRPVGTYYVRCNTHRIAPEELRARLQSRGLNVDQNLTVPEALGIHVDGPFEVSSTEQKVIVDKHTAESALQGAHVYAPGILSCQSMYPGDEVTIVSELGEVIGSGRAMMSANDVLTFRKGLAVRLDHRRFEAPQIRELPEFSQGLLYPQSLAAMVTARVLDPLPNEIVVDMNCAPGGKLSHLSQLMKDSGRVLGFDRNSEKIKQARQTVSSLGCKNVTLSIHDSRYLHMDFPDLKADRVLIDPPCSALGLRPKVYDFTTQERVDDLADYEKQFIKAGSQVVKPGGTIVYSVCTFTTQECEQIVEFAERECGLRVVDQKPFLGARGLSTFGISGSLCQRFHPHVNEIGYFIARLER